MTATWYIRPKGKQKQKGCLGSQGVEKMGLNRGGGRRKGKEGRRQGSVKVGILERPGYAGWEDCPLRDARVSNRSSSPIWEAAASIRLRRRGKLRIKAE